MCKISNTNIGIKDLNFTDYKGKIEAFLSDGRVVIVPVSFFPGIKKLTVKQRQDWMILDDQFFTFNDLSKVYSVTDLLRV